MRTVLLSVVVALLFLTLGGLEVVASRRVPFTDPLPAATSTLDAR